MNIVIQIATPKHKDLPTKGFIKKVLSLPPLIRPLGPPSPSERGKPSALLNRAREVLVRIVTSEEMCELNRIYRQKDAPTNVLSFPAQDLPGLETVSFGDIIICHEILKIEAQAQHKSLTDHYAHMLIHGFLHLLGYDHMNKADAAVMESLEIELLAHLHIKNPYEEHHE